MEPIIRVSLNGNDISSKVAGRVLKGQIVEHDGEKADELSLTLSNYDGLLAKPKRGAVLEISLGFKETGGAGKVGSFTIQEVTKVGQQATFEVVGQAADLKKTLKQQKTRSWVDKTLGDVLQQIASDNGLKLAASAEFKSIKGNFYQTGVSDIHHVTQLARKYGAIAKVADGKLIFVKKGSGESASGSAMSSITITPNDLEDDFRIADRDRPNRGKVRAVHYDRKKGERKEVVEGKGDGPEYVFPQVFPNEDEAKKAAAARKREFDRSEKSFSGTFRTGRNDVKAGGVLTTDQFGDDDDHDWTMERVVHDFGNNGYVTRFEGKVKKDENGKTTGGKSGSGSGGKGSGGKDGGGSGGKEGSGGSSAGKDGSVR